MSIDIPVNEPLLDGNERRYVLECLDTNWISSEGPFVRRLEEQFAALVRRKHGIAVCNGSAALECAVVAAGIGSGDEVIMPTFTIISCAAAILRSGAIPVLVDSDPNTWNMDVSRVAEKITSRTRAILAVHTYGLPVDIDPLLKIAQRNNLIIIEDAAEMIGQSYCGRPCGSFGDLSTFSFYANKHITTGEGGMIATDDERLAERCRSLRNLCFQQTRRFVHEELGWNMRMTNLQAALGVAQVERLSTFIDRKRQMGRLYTRELSGVNGLSLPIDITEFATNIYWVYGIVLDDQSPLDAAAFIVELSAMGVGARPFFWPMHEQPVFRRQGLFGHEEYPVAERLARRGLYLPSGLALSELQTLTVATKVKSILAKWRSKRALTGG